MPTKQLPQLRPCILFQLMTHSWSTTQMKHLVLMKSLLELYSVHKTFHMIFQCTWPLEVWNHKQQPRSHINSMKCLIAQYFISDLAESMQNTSSVFKTVFPKLVRTITQMKVVIMSYYPQWFAVITQNTEQHCGFGSALPPEESHITPSLGTTVLKHADSTFVELIVLKPANSDTAILAQACFEFSWNCYPLLQRFCYIYIWLVFTFIVLFSKYMPYSCHYSDFFVNSLTLWELAYNIFILWFRPKKQQFSIALPTP